MQENLYKVFEYYLSRNKIISKTEVKNLTSLLLFNKNLLDKVNSITTSDNLDTQYSFDNKNLNVNLAKIIEDTRYEDKELYNDIFSKIQKYQKHNLNVFKCILHEIEHVKQYKIIENNPKTLEEKLIYSSFHNNYKEEIDEKTKMNIINLIGKEYLKMDSYYYSEPAERMAYINSEKEITNITKKLGLNDLLIDLYTLEVLEDEDSEYEFDTKGKIICPLKKYIAIEKELLGEYGNFCYEAYFKSIMKKNINISLNRKMKYGLPISKEEYTNHELKIVNNKVFKLIKKRLI